MASRLNNQYESFDILIYQTFCVGTNPIIKIQEFWHGTLNCIFQALQIHLKHIQTYLSKKHVENLYKDLRLIVVLEIINHKL